MQIHAIQPGTIALTNRRRGGVGTAGDACCTLTPTVQQPAIAA